MKQIIEDRLIGYETINIEDNISVLDYLKEKNNTFTLNQVNVEMFELLKNSNGKINVINSKKFVGYSSLKKGSIIGSSGGLKISDPEKNVNGSFIIEENRIIYDPLQPFYREYDCGVYRGKIYYTTMSLLELLKEELKANREYLIYMGTKIENPCSKELFDEVSGDELLQYALNPEKGNIVLSKRRYF